MAKNLKNSPKVLGLDVSTRTIGWALFDIKTQELLELTHVSPRPKVDKDEDKLKELILKSETTLRILDVGCGDGISGEFFLKHFHSIDYSGIDISSESIKVACEKKVQNCNFIQFNGEQIPFPDLEFDIILCFVRILQPNTSDNQEYRISNLEYQSFKPNS